MGMFLNLVSGKAACTFIAALAEFALLSDEGQIMDFSPMSGVIPLVFARG